MCIAAVAFIYVFYTFYARNVSVLLSDRRVRRCPLLPPSTSRENVNGQRSRSLPHGTAAADTPLAAVTNEYEYDTFRVRTVDD